MSTTTKIINGNEYTFINNSRGNRSGFVHETKLYKNNALIGQNKVQYYNRTWECYTYQSVMKGVVYTLINAEYEAFKNEYKERHNIKRLTKAKETEVYKELSLIEQSLYADMLELYTTL